MQETKEKRMTQLNKVIDVPLFPNKELIAQG